MTSQVIVKVVLLTSVLLELSCIASRFVSVCMYVSHA